MNRNALPYLLVLTTTFPRWPDDTVPPFVFELSKRLTDSFRVVVLAPHAPGARTCERMQGLIVVRYRYAPATLETLAYEGGITSGLRKNPIRWLLVPVMLIACWTTIKSILTRRPFTAIHAHWLLPLGLMAVLTGLPTLATAHGADVFALRGRIADSLRRHVVRRATAITAVSDELKSRLIAAGSPSEKIIVQPMGIDAQHTFTPNNTFSAHQNKLLFVGRLVEKKGLKLLLSVWPKLRRHHPTLTLDVIGDGPEIDNSTPAPEGVHFLGALSNEQLPRYYRQSGLLVFPSIEATDGDSEGFGLVVIEALACGCPVVASDLPQLQTIKTLCNGVQFIPPNNATALYTALNIALENRSQLASAALADREIIIHNWDWCKTATRYINILTLISRATPNYDNFTGHPPC